MKKVILTLLVIGVSSISFAVDKSGQEQHKKSLNYAQVIFVKAVQQSNMLWQFDTTVRHNDEGWKHYADAWQVVNPENGEIIAERILAHPHENEQPFTRSLGNIEIPNHFKSVIVRAKCNVHGFGGREVMVDLTGAKSEYYQVIPIDSY